MELGLRVESGAGTTGLLLQAAPQLPWGTGGLVAATPGTAQLYPGAGFSIGQIFLFLLNHDL